jgi:hypothetical protein
MRIEGAQLARAYEDDTDQPRSNAKKSNRSAVIRHFMQPCF